MGSTIKCYAVGLVTGNSYTGGFIGANDTGQPATVSNSYWDSQTSGQSTSAAGSSKTTLEMKTVGTYTGWDFETTPIWQIDTNNNNGYPYLAWQTPEIDLKQSATAIANGSGTYGFGNKDVNTNTDVIFTIQNTGAAVSTLSNFTITGTNANQFSMQGTAPTTVAAGASVTFTVRFSPTSVGAKTATIAFDNQDANENPYSFDVIGTGAFSGGAGTLGSPYQIATLADLRFLSENSGYWSSDKYYIQTADIDATETNTWNVGNHDGDAGTANVAMGFVCIGNSSAFNGKYDGKGHVISNLYINRPTIDYVGLFGFINSASSTISNLGITNVYVVGRNRVGGLVGWNNQGNITNTYTTGVVKGGVQVGGLIGMSNFASILKSYSSASTEGVNHVGGLNGETWAGKVENSYAIGSVKGNDDVGGLIGYIGGSGASVIKSYAVGVVTGNSNVGGLVGTNDPTRATATNSYWDYQTTGQATSVLGSSKTTLEMKNQATYTDWDFATTPIWKMNSARNSGYPYLTWQAIQITTNKNSSTLNLSGNSNIEVASGVTLTLDGNATINSLILAPTAKLSLGSNTLNAPNGVVLQSSADGNATILGDNPVSNATVQQYVTAGRNWYMSTPINNTSPVSSLSGGVSVQQYDEINGAWVIATGTLMRGKGYVQVASAGQGTTGAVSFNGTTNSGDVGIALTNNSGGGKGFNLVGNPYPSYLSWSAVVADNAAANMPTGTMWYRTISYNGKSAWAPNSDYSLNDIVYNGTRFYKVTSAGKSAASGGPTGGLTNIVDNTVVWKYEGSIYLFATVNASGVASPSNLVTVSNLVPPMQSFWVKSNGGTLTFKNSMRTHNTGGKNGLKAPKNSANDLQLLRLNITNGVSTDEAVIYVSTNASNAFDTYDAPKYFNVAGSNQPEIYTQVGAEKLVINAMSELKQGTEIPLGFATEKVNNFTISASEFMNFGSDIKLILKDKQINTEYDLTNGQGYNFSSTAVNDLNRFSIIFRATGDATSIENTDKLSTQVFLNAANQITIVAPEKSNYTIYNSIGQLIEKGVLNTKFETLNSQLTSGVYFVELSVNGRSEVKKVIIR